jgi:hypothetical protein
MTIQSISISNSSPLNKRSISQLPINLFASVMGVTGLSLAWREAAKSIGVHALPGELIGWSGTLIFLGLAGGYVAKWVRHPSAVASEFPHLSVEVVSVSGNPVRGSSGLALIADHLIDDEPFKVDTLLVAGDPLIQERPLAGGPPAVGEGSVLPRHSLRLGLLGFLRARRGRPPGWPTRDDTLVAGVGVCQALPRGET